MRTLVLLGALFGAGCGGDSSQPAFSDLHPVSGTVKRGGQLVKGGQVVFTMESDKQEFGVNAIVDQDGKYTLTTYRLTDRSGERKTGAPAGTFKVTYVPDIADQTAAGKMEPSKLSNPVAVKPGENTLNLDFPAKK
jgi:hypothetical protein